MTEGQQEYHLGSIMTGRLGCPSEFRGDIPSLVKSEMRSLPQKTPRVVPEQAKLPVSNSSLSPNLTAAD